MEPRVQRLLVPNRRAGVSLLEVLVSIGILTVGLLGVAAMIPLAQVDIVRATRADRAASIGRSAIRDAKVRGILNPRVWARYDTGSGNFIPLPTITANGTDYFLYRTYVLDPLYIGINDTSAAARTTAYHFPIMPDPGDTTVTPNFNALPLERLTVRRSFDPNSPLWNAILQQQEGRRIFQSRDDLTFGAPDDDNDRPRLMVSAGYDNGTVVEDMTARWPIRTSDNLTDSVGATVDPTKFNALTSDSEGNYSWFLTVESPDVDHYGGGTPYISMERTVFRVSAVVLFNRSFSVNTSAANASDEPTPNERAMQIGFRGTGEGGGEAVLFSPFGGDLELNEDDWLMVRPLNNRGPSRWYKIVATGEIESEDANENGSLDAGEDLNGDGATQYIRLVSLSGPDWNAADYGGSGALQPAAAVLVKGVVGVYTAMVDID